MKRFKMTTCLVLALMLVFMSTSAFAGTKYSNAVGFGTVLVRPTPAPAPTEEPAVEPTEEPLPTEAPLAEPTEEPAVEPTEEPVVEPAEEPLPTEAPLAEPTEEPVVEPEVKPEAKPEAKLEEEPVEEPVEEPMPTVPTEELIDEDIPTALGNADVRLEADGLSEIFVTLPEGTALVILAVEGDWIKVDIDGQIGYIYKDSVQGLPVEEPVLPEDSDNAAEPVEPEKKVTIFSSRRTVMAPGETVYLTSKLEGLDGYTVTYQWQYDRGNGFENIPGAIEDSYAYEANMNTLNYGWRLLVYYE